MSVVRADDHAADTRDRAGVTPYYNEAGITIYHGDALDVIADMSIELGAVVTDPPYASGSRTEASKSSSGTMLRAGRFSDRPMTESAIRAAAGAGPLRFGFADPPYPGQAHRHYGSHPDFAGEVDHAALIERLMAEFADGWALCSGARMITDVVPLLPEGIRTLAWCKPMTPFKPGVSVQFGWEPVYLWGGRRRARLAPMIRDWLMLSPEQWSFTGNKPAGAVIGMKPAAFCRWIFDCLGAREGDELVDLFPGSGAVRRAWQAYEAQPELYADVDESLPQPLFDGEVA